MLIWYSYSLLLENWIYETESLKCRLIIAFREFVKIAKLDFKPCLRVCNCTLHSTAYNNKVIKSYARNVNFLKIQTVLQHIMLICVYFISEWSLPIRKESMWTWTYCAWCFWYASLEYTLFAFTHNLRIVWCHHAKEVRFFNETLQKEINSNCMYCAYNEYSEDWLEIYMICLNLQKYSELLHSTITKVDFVASDEKLYFSILIVSLP